MPHWIRSYTCLLIVKLDEWIGEKDAIAEDRAQLEKELENVVSQSALGEVITTDCLFRDRRDEKCTNNCE